MNKYIYICSAGFSGSTLLDLLLGSHSEIESLGEISQLPKNIALNTQCTCGESVRSCRLWKDVLNSLENTICENLLENPYAFNLGFIDATVIVDRNHQTRIYNSIGRVLRGISYLDLAFGNGIFEAFMKDDTLKNNFLLYDTVIKHQGVHCVVDSSKDYLKGINLYRARPGQVKIIILTRNGKGVLYSNLKRGHNLKKSLMGWRNYYTHLFRLIEKYVPKSDYFTVKYEELAKHPEDVLRSICKYVGLAFEDTMLNFKKHLHHITNGNNMRFRNESSIIQLDEKWKSCLGEEEYRLFYQICGSVNRELGYKGRIGVAS